MSLSNTTTTYGGVTKFLHWLTVLLILTVIPLGVIAHGMAFDTSEALARKAQLFSLHKTVGLAIFFTALVRIAWAFTQPKPGLLHPDRKAESFLAEMVHWLLYGSLVLVPLTGWIHHSATTGFAPIWWPFGQALPFVPKDDGVAGTFAALHMIFERVMIASLLLHILGAVKHHIIDKDSTLRRMLPGHTDVALAPQAHRVVVPLLAAIVVWGGALAVGSSLGAFERHGQTVEIATLQEVSSDWAVQEGTLSITVSQFGSDVTGSFADWTASINFDDPDAPGPAGDVQIEVAIGSLTLGSVTDQAMGGDFFDATNFPTATYTANIVKITDGYEAQGTLSLKGAEVPLTFPFSLQIDNAGVATMNAQMVLDRLDFGIGANMPDESSLKFAVTVDIALTALREGEG